MYSTKPSVFTITKKCDQNTEQYLISIVTYLPVFWYVDFTQPFLIVKGGTYYSTKLYILGVPKMCSVQMYLTITMCNCLALHADHTWHYKVVRSNEMVHFIFNANVCYFRQDPFAKSALALMGYPV